MRITLTPEQKQGLQKDFNIQFEFAKESLEKYKATKNASELFSYFHFIGTVDALDELLDNENFYNNDEYYNFIETQHDVLFESGIHKTIELDK